MSTRNQKSKDKPPAGPSIIADYRLQPGVPDEMIDAQGNIRSGWSELMAAFDRLGPEELAARFERADQYLRDAGVQGIYGPGSNVVECAADVLRLLGHNMPPVTEEALT